MRNKTFGLIMIILGTFIGAGFASGKEIATYFASFGWCSIIFAIICGVLFYFFIITCLKIGYNNKTKEFNFNDNKNIYKILLQLFFVISSLIITSSMIAGSNSIGQVLVGDKKILLIIFTIVISFIILLYGFKGINKLCNIVVPIMIVVMIMIVFWSIFFKSNNNFTISITYQSFFYGLISMLDYFCFNIILIGLFLMEIGSNYSKKEIKISSVVASSIITILLIVVSVAIIFNCESLNYDMPLVYLATKIHFIFGVFASILVWLGLLTTLISSVYIVSNYINSFIKNKGLSLLISLFLGFLISLLGFSFIVIYLYFIMGFFGLYFLIYLLANFKKIK